MNERQTNRRSHAAGFTLIEIMVVVVIIGLLVGIVAPNVIGQLGRAEVERARADIDRISTALDLFRIDHFRYPTEDEGLEILLGNAQVDDRPVARFLNSIPTDPWQRTYLYDNPSTHGRDYDVYTLGADGQEGGEGANADIGSWNLN
ncbi:MAG TPA: type II secretion system major pseudopilin GspG [Gammaproteobacteria bacterium]